MKIDGLFERAELIAHLTDISTIISEVDSREMQVTFASQWLVLGQQMTVLYVVRYFYFLDAMHNIPHTVSVYISHSSSGVFRGPLGNASFGGEENLYKYLMWRNMIKFEHFKMHLKYTSTPFRFLNTPLPHKNYQGWDGSGFNNSNN